MQKDNFDVELDATGLACPMPLLQTKRALHGLSAGQKLKVLATDAGSKRDIPAWCKLSENRLLKSYEENQVFVFIIEKESN